MFATLLAQIAAKFGLSAEQAKSVVRAVLGVLERTPQGIGGVVDELKRNGLSGTPESWVGDDASVLDAAKVGAVAGPQSVKSLAGELHVGEAQATSILGYALPKTVGLVAPTGAETGLPEEAQRFLKGDVLPPGLPADHLVRSPLGDWLLRGAIFALVLGILWWLTPRTMFVTNQAKAPGESAASAGAAHGSAGASKAPGTGAKPLAASGHGPSGMSQASADAARKASSPAATAAGQGKDAAAAARDTVAAHGTAAPAAKAPASPDTARANAAPAGTAQQAEATKSKPEPASKVPASVASQGSSATASEAGQDKATASAAQDKAAAAPAAQGAAAPATTAKAPASPDTARTNAAPAGTAQQAEAAKSAPQSTPVTPVAPAGTAQAPAHGASDAHPAMASKPAGAAPAANGATAGATAQAPASAAAQTAPSSSGSAAQKSDRSAIGAPSATTPAGQDASQGAPAAAAASSAAAAADVGTIASRLRLREVNGTVIYGGAVPDEATAEAIKSQLAATFGADKIRGTLNVNPRYQAPSWLSKFSGIVDALKSPGFNFSLTGAGLDLKALAPSVDRDKLTAALSGLLPDLKLTLPNMSGPSLNTQGALSALGQITGDYKANDVLRTLNDVAIEFPTASAEVPADSKEVLIKAATLIKALPGGASVVIEGYTDNVGDAGFNQELSQKRADAVRIIMIEAGLVSDDVTATGYGSANPIADNGTPEGRARNRRITYEVRPK